MKLNLFLLASICAAFYLCEAGPLRLQKRAAFYIANETACVVDNIVYSSGDPIPTDDPCEACKCRPPGFACVLKECRVKPGCRAVRHAGQCCPEYVCGCEHNGRMYEDGEEIRDAKNPCYICHCQGSSIACAFSECIFRDDCPPVYKQGACCPEYSNCTRRDAPENIPLKENIPVPSLNLLPGLNDESVIVPEKIPTTPKAVPPTEIVTHPTTQSLVVTEISTERNVPDAKIPSEFQTEIPSSVSVESKPALIPGEKNSAEEAASSETKKDVLSQDGSNDKVEKNDENVSLNSETEIKKDEDFETTTLKLPVSSLEVVKDQEIKTASETEAGYKADVPENQSESVTTVADILTTEKTVKNSAANNSKSLKLSLDENIQENEKSVKDKEIKTEKPVQVDIKTTETLTQPSTESSSEINSIISTKSEPESAEIIAEESHVKPQSSLYNNSEKIKSETAETVTIVVHVKDKTKTTTETNSNTEHVTSESVTNAPQENLLNSKSELKSTETVKDDKTTLVEISSEVFTSATEPNKKELSTLSPLTEEKPKDAESRSENTDASSEAPKNTDPNYETTYLKTEEVSSNATIAQDKHVTESTSAESRSEEEGTKKEITNDLKVLETTKDEEPKVSVSIQTTTISETDLKTDKADENQTKYEGTTEISSAEATAAEIKSEVREDENKAEVREGENKSDDKGEKTSTEKGQETTPEVKVASTTTETEIKTETRTAEIESKEILSKNIEKTTAVDIQEQKDGVTTVSINQDIKTSVQTETPKTDSE